MRLMPDGRSWRVFTIRYLVRTPKYQLARNPEICLTSTLGPNCRYLLSLSGLAGLGISAGYVKRQPCVCSHLVAVKAAAIPQAGVSARMTQARKLEHNSN